MKCDDSTNAELQVVQTGPSYLPIFGQTNDCTSSVLSQNVQTADQNCKKLVLTGPFRSWTGVVKDWFKISFLHSILKL